jgi:predicted phage tail protein
VGIGILQIAVLALRLIVRSPVRRISNSVGDLIFWFGAAFSVNVFLLAGTLKGFWQFWAALLMILGVSLIVRGIINLTTWRTRRTQM